MAIVSSFGCVASRCRISIHCSFKFRDISLINQRKYYFTCNSIGQDFQKRTLASTECSYWQRDLYSSVSTQQFKNSILPYYTHMWYLHFGKTPLFVSRIQFDKYIVGSKSKMSKSSISNMCLTRRRDNIEIKRMNLVGRNFTRLSPHQLTKQLD